MRAARRRPRPEYDTAPVGLGPLSWLEAAGGNVNDAVNGIAPSNGAQEDGSARAGPGFGLGSNQFAGTPDMIVEQIKAFHEMTGVGVLDFGILGRPDVVAKRLRLLAEEVIPHVREVGAPAVV
jgi:alkanesulfonate monooxygenase SsuD/methylene tetrahydromethanopterin reductase-like flavin-dependent oxidoreductase (luciferase family)